MQKNSIVVTDLDGSLLDHTSYSFAVALPALRKLEHSGIPVILNSSKTMPEIQVLRRQLDNNHPFIVENGAAIYIPLGKHSGKQNFNIVNFGMKRAEILEVIHKIRNEQGFKFTGFADMNTRELMQCTGLDEFSASLALQRSFSEPVLWHDTEDNFLQFRQLLEENGLSTVKGGRFIHLSSPVNKGSAIDYLRTMYSKKFGADIQVIGLGDGENDIPMLEKVDIPILVKSPVNPYPAVQHKRLIKTEKPGPEGWNQAILDLLSHTQASEQEH